MEMVAVVKAMIMDDFYRLELQGHEVVAPS